MKYIFSNIDFQKRAFIEFFKSIKNKRKLIIWGKNYYYSSIIKAKITNLLKQKNYNLIYSYWFHWSSLAVARTNYDSLKISRAHGYDLYESVNPQLYKEYILSRIDYVYPISNAGFKEIKTATNKQNIKVAFLGTYNKEKIDFSKFKKNKTITLVSVSRMVPIKRIHLIIEILSKIDFKVEWIHFGDGELFKKIEKLAFEKLSKKRNIKYNFKGFISNDELMKFYSDNYYKIDMMINVSKSEGIPVTIMETSSYGIVPIATNVGGTSEVVDKFLVDDTCEEQIVSDVLEIITNYKEMTTKEVQKIKEEVYTIWERKFNAEKNNKKFYDREIVEKIISRVGNIWNE